MTTVDTVVEMYRTVLKREPDAEGLAFWMKSFDIFVNDQGYDKAKTTLKEYFLNSDEYKTNFGGK